MFLQDCVFIYKKIGIISKPLAQHEIRKLYSHADMLSSSICLTPNSCRPDGGILDFNESVSNVSTDSVALEVKLKAWKQRSVKKVKE